MLACFLLRFNDAILHRYTGVFRFALKTSSYIVMLSLPLRFNDAILHRYAGESSASL